MSEKKLTQAEIDAEELKRLRENAERILEKANKIDAQFKLQSLEEDEAVIKSLEKQFSPEIVPFIMKFFKVRG